MRIRLFLLCHGRTAGRDATRFPGDEPLSQRGLEAARSLAKRLPRFDRALASPARSARETAAAIGCPAAIEPAFRDQDFGDWTGRGLDDVRAGDPEAFAGWLAGGSTAAPPGGGEAASDVAARVASWLDDHRGRAGRTLVLTHQAVVRAAVLHVLGAPVGVVRSLDVEPLTLAEFTSDGRRWALRRFGERLRGADEG